MSGRRCEHEAVYYGVINLLREGWFLGAVDVWRCVKCGLLFAEERRLGVLDIAPYVGFREPKPGSEWAIFVCSCPEEVQWRLIEAEPGLYVDHRCPISAPARVAEDFRLEPRLPPDAACRHFLFRVKEFLNKGIEVGYSAPR
jgi:rubredoxin